MKINTDRITKVELVTRPDGKYWRIEMEKPPSLIARAKRNIVKLWESPTGRTVIISIGAAVLLNPGNETGRLLSRAERSRP